MKLFLRNFALIIGVLSFSSSYSFANLIISQYYEGTSNNKWIEITNVGNSTITLDGFFLALFSNSRADDPGNSTPNSTFALSGTLAAGSSLLFQNSQANIPSYAAGTNTGVCGFNGDDLVIITTSTSGTGTAWNNRTDVVGNGTSWGGNTSFYRNPDILAPSTTFSESDWTEVSNTTVDNAMAGTSERLGEHESNAPLPVTLANFDAKPIGNSKVAVQWITASEENNEYFSVEYSNDGRNFVEIAQVNGAGTTFESQTYEYLHQEARNGQNYYRLRQVDFDGAYSYSDVQVVEIASTITAATITPTAARSEINLNLSSPTTSNTLISIFNIQGQEVLSTRLQAGSYNLTIPVDGLQNGHYFLRLNDGQQAQTLRFVKL